MTIPRCTECVEFEFNDEPFVRKTILNVLNEDGLSAYITEVYLVIYSTYIAFKVIHIISKTVG